MTYRKLFLSVALIMGVGLLHAQDNIQKDMAYAINSDTLEKAPDNWFNLDLETDKVRGVSTEKAYAELLVNKKSTTVIVAIIDSGIDIEHEDLKDKIWVNKGEIAGNGVDDDKNGYVDDLNGWNFIGNKKGEMINYDNLEITRLYSKLKKTYDGKSESDFKGKQLGEYKYYLEIKADYEKEYKQAEAMNTNLQGFVEAYTAADEVVKKTLNKEEYTLDEVNAIESEDPAIMKAKGLFAFMAAQKFTGEDIKDGAKHYKEQLEYNLNVDFEPRSLVGDDYANKKEKYYGNNKVEGPDAFHGTHVAGIIGANRNNKIGIKGIANDVKIMVLRTVPNGDERDKDVANSIYYAVNNGAQIINMSFGKDYSPYKQVVDKAMKFAEKKGVLLIHAAGNDSRNNDEKKNYPNPEYLKSKKICSTWIEVGASSWENTDEFVGTFSNYGEKGVNVFAPGVAIHSTTPDNKYKNAQGTSMAAPVVTGIAALVWSYYPKLTVKDLKKIIEESTVKNGDVKTNFPGAKDKTIEFKKLCVTGGIVNAYSALKMAENYKSK